MFITFEGVDGSGKSTQVRLLGRYFEERERPPLLVREPGGTELSEHVRTLLLDPAAHIAPRAELLLFSAARAQLVDEVIHPALAEGRVVIADRFYDSTTAYQGGGRALADAAWLRNFHIFVTDGLVPDRTYYIDVPPETAAARRGTDPDRMEGAGAAFFERVRTTYRHLADAEPERFVTLDGRRSVEDLHTAIVRDVEALRMAEPGVASGTGRPSSGSPSEDL
jgi:dTMP kinase